MFHTLDTNLCGWANSKDRKSDNQLFSICLVLPNMVGQITHPARAYPRALLMMSFTSHFNEYLEIQREFNLKITWVMLKIFLCNFFFNFFSKYYINYISRNSFIIYIFFPNGRFFQLFKGPPYWFFQNMIHTIEKK